MIKSLPEKNVKENFEIYTLYNALKWISERDFKEAFLAKPLREAYESHVGCGLREGGDQKY